MKEKLINLIKLIICSLLFFSIGSVFIKLLQILGIDLANITLKDKTFLEFIISLCTLLVFGIVYYGNLKKDFINFKKNKSYYIKNIIKLFIIMILIKFIISYVSIIITNLFGYDYTSLVSNNQNIIEEYVKISPILMIFSCVFFAPVYEEILFRLGIGKVISNKCLFIIMSGLVFGLIHVFPLDNKIGFILGIIQSISYITIGLFLAYAYKKNNNIFVSVGIHFLNNLFSILMILKTMNLL